MADINQIAEQAWDVMLEQVEDGNFSISDILKAAALKYKNDLKQVESEIYKFDIYAQHKAKLKKMAKIQNIEISDLAKLQEERDAAKAVLKTNIPQTLYKAVFAFQKILNKVLGQEIQMIFVIPQAKKGSAPLMYTITNEDLLSYELASSGELTARYNLSKRKANQMYEQFQATEERKYDEKGLVEAYQESVWRYNKARTKSKENKRYVILCKPTGDWIVFKISALGYLNEGYAAAVILNRASPSFKGVNIEKKVYDFLNSYVMNTDTISGLLQGDVSKNGVEYGIKSAGASALGLNQLEKIADEIIKRPKVGKATLQSLKKKAQTEGTKNVNSLETMLQNTVEEIYGDLIEELSGR